MKPSAKTPSPVFRRTSSALLAALLIAGLYACGGGSGPSTASSGLTSGTITGFGSVVVDGTEIEDASAHVLRENYDGRTSADVLQMGQRVKVKHDGQHIASTVTIDAAVVGTASAIDSTAQTLFVAGQKVSINADSANTAAPLTVFGGGYTDLASVAAGDLVEVHGTPVYSASSKSYTVQATRLAKKTSIAKAQVSGLITDYAANADGSASFKLNGLAVSTTTTTALRPSGSTLANGLQVTAWSGSTGFTGGTFAAQYLRVDKNQSSGNTAMTAQLSGVVSGYSAGGTSINVGGSTVAINSATVVTDGKGVSASLSNGAYVVLTGTVASDGSLTATSVRVRTADTSAALAQVLLIGTISDYVSDTSFVVRGVPVDASASTLVKNNCPTVLANDVAVRVQASQQAGTNVVLASRIDCNPNTSTQLIRATEGTAGSTDVGTSTFVLTLAGNASPSTRKVQWNDTTVFIDVSKPTSTASTTLDGKALRVDGYLASDNSTLVARTVRLDSDGSGSGETHTTLDDSGFRKKKSDAAPTEAPTDTPKGWDNYRQKRR